MTANGGPTRSGDGARKRESVARHAARTEDHCTQTRMFNLTPCRERDSKTEQLITERRLKDEAAQAGDSEAQTQRETETDKERERERERERWRERGRLLTP